MFMFLYHFLWTIISACGVPFALLSGNKRLIDRFALHLPPALPDGDNVWIHALSVGEVISSVPLVDAIRTRYPEKDIVFTVATEKGMGIARDELKGKIKTLMFMSVDAWWCVRRMVRVIRPTVFILVETDIWPGLIGYLKKKGVRTLLINGRISPQTFESYKKARFVVKKMFEHVTLCLMQTELDCERLLTAGVSPSQKVISVGSIKFDREWQPMHDTERDAWFAALGIGKTDLLWVAGSTHPGEERVILEAHKRLKQCFPNLRLIIAPRKVARAGEILANAVALGFETCPRSKFSGGRGKFWDVLILDTIGELGRIYALGKVSFVGGSLIPFGGHNLLEPAGFGRPVIFGPYTFNFVHVSGMLTAAGGGRCVADETDLFNAVNDLLGDDRMCRRMGNAAGRFVEENRGALNRVLAHMGDFM